MWKIRDELKDSSQITLIFENWNADDNSSEGFSVFLFNASTVSSFELIFVNPIT